MSPAVYSTSDLCRQIKAKDSAAFQYLYETYAAALYGTILPIVGERELADQVLKKVFITIYHQIGNYNPEKLQLFTWMLVIARNKCMEFNQSAALQKSPVSEWDYNNIVIA